MFKLNLLRKFWSGLDEGIFDLSFVYRNLTLLSESSYELESDSFGRLSLRNRGFFLRNLFTLGREKRRLKKATICTVMSFLYPIRTPLIPNKILLLMNKKSALIEKIMEQRGKTKEIEETLQEFKTIMYVQYIIVKKASKACSFAKETREVTKVKMALKQGVNPILMIRGFSGTYLMRSLDYKKVGVFKPFDEEMMAPNNPSGNDFRGPLGVRSVRSGLLVGLGMHREVAAYLVSKKLKLNIVPKTIYASFSDPIFGGIQGLIVRKRTASKEKWGSFQDFKQDFLSLVKFSKEQLALISIERIQALFILDVVIGHLDRHFANILCNGPEIFAIDNGLSFPDKKSVFKEWHWRHMPQLDIPVLEELSEKVFKLDALALAKQLQKRCSLSYSDVMYMIERIEVLRQGIKAKLTCKEIVERFIEK